MHGTLRVKKQTEYVIYKSISQVWVTSAKLSSKQYTWKTDLLSLPYKRDLKKGPIPWLTAYIDSVRAKLKFLILLHWGNMADKVSVKLSLGLIE